MVTDKFDIDHSRLRSCRPFCLRYLQLKLSGELLQLLVDQVHLVDIRIGRFFTGIEDRDDAGEQMLSAGEEMPALHSSSWIAGASGDMTARR